MQPPRLRSASRALGGGGRGKGRLDTEGQSEREGWAAQGRLASVVSQGAYARRTHARVRVEVHPPAYLLLSAGLLPPGSEN